MPTMDAARRAGASPRKPSAMQRARPHIRFLDPVALRPPGAYGPLPVRRDRFAGLQVTVAEGTWRLSPLRAPGAAPVRLPAARFPCGLRWTRPGVPPCCPRSRLRSPPSRPRGRDGRPPGRSLAGERKGERYPSDARPSGCRSLAPVPCARMSLERTGRRSYDWGRPAAAGALAPPSGAASGAPGHRPLGRLRLRPPASHRPRMRSLRDWDGRVRVDGPTIVAARRATVRSPPGDTGSVMLDLR